MAINEFRSEVLNRPIDGARYHWQTRPISRRRVRLKIVPLSEQIVPFAEYARECFRPVNQFLWHDNCACLLLCGSRIAARRALHFAQKESRAINEIADGVAPPRQL